MGMSQLRKQGVSPERLTDRQCRFVGEYSISLNAKQAAIAAGYSEKSANVMGAKLLNHPLVAKAIGNIKRQQLEEFDVRREEVLEQLLYAVTREASDFVDESGELLPLRKMRKRARCVIDGYDQTVTVNGVTGEKTIKTKVRITPKIGAIQLAMQYRELLAPEKHEHRHEHVTIDLNQLFQSQEHVKDEATLRLEQEALLCEPVQESTASPSGSNGSSSRPRPSGTNGSSTRS
jgi:phage terminase small subunit